MRRRLKELGGDRMESSRAICEAIARHPSYANAKTVAIFDPLPSEPHVELLWAIAPRRFVYPRIAGEHLVLVEVDSPEELHREAGRMHREPILGSKGTFPIDQLGLILVPGLAFTRTGQRLGRGGGYYDRLLATLGGDCLRIGVCFEVQIVEDLPCEPHDMPLDLVVTEAAVDSADR